MVKENGNSMTSVCYFFDIKSRYTIEDRKLIRKMTSVIANVIY